MRGTRRATLGGAAAVAVVAGLLPWGAVAHAEERCNTGEPGFVEGGYAVQANRWNSHGEICVTFSGKAAFTVSASSLDWGNLRNGAPPGAYPNIGTALADKRLPLRVDSPKQVRTTWKIAMAEGDYNASYDVWYHPDPGACTSTNPHIVANGGALEIMIWLTSPGIDPSPDWKVADGVRLGGRVYDLYKFTGPTGQTGLIYSMREHTTEIVDFDLKPFAKDAVDRGYQRADAYLCKVQAGFEITRGGVGLRTDAFALRVGGPAPSASSGPDITGVPLPDETPSPPPGGSPTASSSSEVAAPEQSALGPKEGSSAPPWPLLVGLPLVAGAAAGVWWWRRGGVSRS
ncbi:GH12 family glycosyl hydrolase domain-containing protein [Actinocorallia sp. A-T 12471]|uniref:GH12 family glycosyl hydrolase domain-containing protein n=1 Tax=Actinocorallia sp. A-T 12471 TaxID=3089813 RepID=UPI0029D33952|nr:hypothetical protein [Actinocorallia sp. A-T 12471]MDX6744658.1 hypothetical protein [Actinocorallia sp. A-T 12471]